MAEVLLCQGNALQLPLKDASIHTVCTSPPYYGLRSYNCGPGELGLEDSPDAYIAAMVQVFREVKRVLHPLGTLWVNMGDSYAANGVSGLNVTTRSTTFHGGTTDARQRERHAPPGIKPKNLLGMPWKLAFALQADGWILRSAITWCKAAPMPESVSDRPTSATEMVFLFAKQPHYFYDATAVRVQTGNGWHGSTFTSDYMVATKAGLGQQPRQETPGRNLWNYWVLGPEPSSFAHFATMPTALVRRCLLAGAPSRVCAACNSPYRRVVERQTFGKAYSATKFDATMQGGPLSRSRQAWRAHGLEAPPTPITTGYEPTCACAAGASKAVILDPFCGSGTTLLVARELGHHAIGLDLSSHYLRTIARERLGLGSPGSAWTHGQPPQAVVYDDLPLFGG